MAPLHSNLVIAAKSWNSKPTQEKEIILIVQVPILLFFFPRWNEPYKLSARPSTPHSVTNNKKMLKKITVLKMCGLPGFSLDRDRVIAAKNI